MSDLKTSLSRKASKASMGGHAPSQDPFISWFGKVLVSLPDERWPTYNAVPMMPLFQFNLTELPYRPSNLSDIVFITAFVNQRSIKTNTPNGEGWLIRTYDSLEDLVPVKVNQYISSIIPLPIRWELIEHDYPCWDDVPRSLVTPDLKSRWAKNYPNHDCTKIGGWPTYIDPDISWAHINRHHAEPEFVFQIDSELKTNWEWPGECFAYVARGTGASKNIWTLQWES